MCLEINQNFFVIFCMFGTWLYTVWIIGYDNPDSLSHQKTRWENPYRCQVVPVSHLFKAGDPIFTTKNGHTFFFTKKLPKSPPKSVKNRECQNLHKVQNTIFSTWFCNLTEISTRFGSRWYICWEVFSAKCLISKKTKNGGFWFWFIRWLLRRGSFSLEHRENAFLYAEKHF